MGQLRDLYHEGRTRIADLVVDLDDDAANANVPACPAWSVKDVVAHVTGICADILGGNLDGVATDDWTAAQVDARRDTTIGEIVGEWAQTGPQVEAIVDQFGRSGEQLVTDLTTHEYDIRHALGEAAPKDLPVLDIAADFIATLALDPALRSGGLGPLEVKADSLRFVVGGDGEPRATLAGTRFELLRAATGRRSAAQVAAMDWSVDPTPYLPVFESSIFTLSPTDIVE